MDSGLQPLLLLATVVVVSLFLGGGAAVLAGGSVASRFGGGFGVLCGVALCWVGVLHFRRPVKR